MKCIKCGGKSFVIESTIVITQFYRISNSGKVSKHPLKTVITDTDMTDHENQIRCDKCNQAYIVSGTDRDWLLHKDYAGFELNQDEVELSEY